MLSHKRRFAPQIVALPVSLSGAIGGSTVLTTSFAGKKGERVVVEIESRRLGSNLTPVLHLLDSRRVQLTWSQGLAAMDGDARLETTLPADGTYIVELHDALYRGADPGHFRLKIGQLSYADFAFPLGVQAGAKQTLSYLSTNLPDTIKLEQLSRAAWRSTGRLAAGRDSPFRYEAGCRRQ